MNPDIKFSNILVWACLYFAAIFEPIHANMSVSSIAQEHSKSFLNFTTDIQSDLSEMKKREIVCELFFNNRFSNFNNLQVSPIISDSSVLNDLSFFSQNSDQNSNLFSKINNTETVLGEIILLSMLCQPTTDIKLLQHRQEVLKRIVDDPALFAKLNNKLMEIKSIESDILGFWLKDNDTVENMFYKNKFLKHINKSAVKLEFLNKLNLIISWAIAHVYEAHKIILGHETELLNKWPEFLKEFLIASINPKKITVEPVDNVINAWKHGKAIAQETSETILKKIEFIQQQQLLDDAVKMAYIQNMTRNLEFAQENEAILPYMPYILTGCNIIIEGHGLYLKYCFYKNIINKRNAVLALHKRLIKVKLLIKKTKQISSILGLNFNESFDFDELNYECQDLIKDIKKSTFNPNSILIYEGRVLKCYKQMQNIKNGLANMLIYIGKLDAYLSWAKYIKKTNQSSKNICFVKFISSQTPQINAKNFWSLFLEKDKAVKNSLEFFVNIILTGPNAGGKSTILKSFLQNLLLAQTFGISAASEFEFTPFSSLFSYLNIIDDTGNNKSLFKAEVEKAKMLIKNIDKLSTDQLAFSVIDELFTGTSFEIGQKCALEFIKKLNKYENTIFIFATHYQDITNLESQNNRFVNYKVGAPVKIDSKLVYPFNLEIGINTNSSAFDILAEENLI